QEDALRWVHDALREQPDGDLAGLVVFGGDAQLETTVREEVPLARPAVRVDSSRTDLAGALRLGAAVLPTDARRRIVVVSDGRSTQGDTAAEAERLADAGIAVDFHAVGRSGGRDVAIAALQLPGRVREGEQITITGTIDSTEATTARIDLLREGTRIDSRTVDLAAGPNEVTFTDTAQGSGVARYQLRASSGGDTIAQNDVAFGAAQIEGPATVLVVEGRDGNGATLTAALRAAGIDVRTTPVTEIPPVDELAGISSTVLVDVDARTLAPEHLAALTGATRDLGRGLVTIGGTQSYGLGGYRGTDLEALLPVESEILDPKRRQTVAEVLAIDTSGSMGACHCAEGNNGVVDGNSMEGGVNKTDISRAGAAQIEGPATVLVVEGRDGNGATLTAALRAAGIDVQTTPVTDIPPVDELAGISSTVLVDVDARTLAPEHLAALTGATRDLGRGLVTIGGTQSYGLGGYRGTDLEALLPVESEILDPKRRQTVAEVLAIDTSGSMGACHCAEGNNGVVDGNSMEGGVNKTDISRAGAARAIQSLSELDEVGVLAVDTRERWLIDLQRLPAQDIVDSGLRTLVPSGDTTDLSRSLSTSAEALRDSNAALKHIILFTDGFTDPGELAGLEDDAAELLEEGITVSVVATGEGASTELGAIAEAGGGRFHPGRDLQEVPDIIADEAILASRDFLQEGRFVPQVTSNADPVSGLTEAPPVLGYVATTARPLATTHLRVGEDGDPLLASWQVGLGRVTSWTSDLDRWGQLWSSWSGFVDHWAGVVKDTYPAGEQSGLIRARVAGDLLRIEVEGAEDFPDGATGTARVVRPDGEVDEVRLTRSAG
ncbi:MAG TPA: VWA domain-containing protein, partial [Acidimicrobiales bacterium]